MNRQEARSLANRLIKVGVTEATFKVDADEDVVIYIERRLHEYNSARLGNVAPWHGIKYSDDGGALVWAVFDARETDDEILAKLDYPQAYERGPGRRFARDASIRRTATRVLVTQYSGLDI